MVNSEQENPPPLLEFAKAYLRDGTLPGDPFNSMMDFLNAQRDTDLDDSQLNLVATFVRIMENDLLSEEDRDPKLPSVSQAQALYYRRLSRVKDENGEHDDAKKYWQRSKDYNGWLNSTIDPELLGDLFEIENIKLEDVMKVFREMGIEHFQVLSGIPDHLLAELSDNGFDIDIISKDQVDITDFDKVVDVSDIPDSFYQQHGIDESERSTFLEHIRKRWVLWLILMVGIASVLGYTQGWGLDIANATGIDYFFSIYGAVAVGRNVVQLRRSHKWAKEVRGETRPPYAVATIGYVEQLEQESLFDKDDQSNNKRIADRFKQEAMDIANKNLDWEQFMEAFGLPDFVLSPEAASLLSDSNQPKPRKPGLFDRIMDAVDESVISNLSKDHLVKLMAKRLIENQWGSLQEAPSVAVVIPTYKTKPQEMHALLASLKDQAYPISNVYVVYNDDPYDRREGRKKAKKDEYRELEKIVEHHNRNAGRLETDEKQCKIHLLTQPARGKRKAMGMGFALALGQDYWDDSEIDDPSINIVDNVHSHPDFAHDFVLNIDSDTYVNDPFAVLNSALFMDKRPKAAMTTGDVRVYNGNDNWLSRLTEWRYRRAFDVERGAQSYGSGQTTCMSGPWVFMRGEALAQILDEWYGQKFMGEESTFGDDRHLSTLALKHGWNTYYNPDSIVKTDCPTDLPTWIKQQTRWAKSFNRENYLLLKFMHKLDPFIQFDVVYQQAFTLVMLLIMGLISYRAFDVAFDEGMKAGLQTTVPYLLTILGVNLAFFGVHDSIRYKHIKYLVAMGYIPLHFLLLIPIKVKAAFTPKKTGWGTKSADQDLIEEQVRAEMKEIYEVTDEEIDEILASADKHKPDVLAEDNPMYPVIMEMFRKFNEQERYADPDDPRFDRMFDIEEEEGDLDD